MSSQSDTLKRQGEDVFQPTIVKHSKHFPGTETKHADDNPNLYVSVDINKNVTNVVIII